MGSISNVGSGLQTKFSLKMIDTYFLLATAMYRLEEPRKVSSVIMFEPPSGAIGNTSHPPLFLKISQVEGFGVSMVGNLDRLKHQK